MIRPRHYASSPKRFDWRLAKGAAVHELRARTALVRAARSGAPTVVAAHERDLRSCRARLAALEGLADLAAADAVLAAQP